MAGVPSLPFAVGVYLPLSSSAPIFIGGLVRWLADRHATRGEMSEAQGAALGDRGPGVLLASGYIAGGALAGVVIALSAGFSSQTDKLLTDWANAHNPLFAGPHADGLSLLPYAVLVAALYWVGRRS
jgi:hypothetical protein